MPNIKLSTRINAPASRCFDLSRSIDLHLISTQHTGEKAIGGITSGLIGLGETVTWKAKHFGVWQTLTTKITEFQPPHFFVDEMVHGTFHSFRHEHYFKKENDYTTEMTDYFIYQSPLGIFGRLADNLFLKSYMTTLLQQRNQCIKAVAESNRWQQLLEN